MSERQFVFCGVPTPTGKLIYAGPTTREEFDRIPLPATQSDWKLNSTATALKGDGRQWERRVTAKSLEDANTGITVIFQWIEDRPVEQAAVPAEAVSA